MTYDNFIAEFRSLLQEYMRINNVSLGTLAAGAGMEIDQLRRIESGKQQMLEVSTYARILTSMELGLGFQKIDSKDKTIKLPKCTDAMSKFIDEIFFGLTTAGDQYAFSNFRLELLYRYLGKKLEERRNRHDLTQENLARKASVSRFTISRIESGNNCKLMTLYKVSQAFKEKGD